MMSGLKRLLRICSVLLALVSCGLASTAVRSQTLDENALKGMKWRQVGPFRGGRALAVAGVAGDPEKYYFG
jgi:hypothetical protein